MTAVLFATLDAGGNLPPALDIARAVVHRGGSARFIGHERQRAAVEGAGFLFEPYPTGRPANAAAPGGVLAIALRQSRVFADPGIAADVIASARREPTDVVVIDCLLVRATTDAIAAGLPVVALMHTLWSYWITLSRGPVAGLVGLFGGRMSQAFAEPAIALVTTRTDFEERTGFAANVRHTGIVLSGSPRAAEPSSPRPRVLVSLSTTNMPGQVRSLQRILDAVGGLDVDAIVTIGPAIDATALRTPSNAQLHAYLDHSEVLPTVSLVIEHGGHSTTARALAHGIPVLVLPQNPLMDQPTIGRAVQRLGVGASLRRTSSPRVIRDAAQRLLTDETVRAAAASLGAELRKRDGAEVAADLLEGFAASMQGEVGAEGGTRTRTPFGTGT